jgi:hypothetical protein
MERKFKISIPKPCHEDWDKMTLDETGRFCGVCAKTVVDFTTMLPEEVQHFFIQNQNNSICGRIKTSQLDSIIIQIPYRVLYSQTQYHKMFLLALFIAMGTTLFSCADKNGEKQKINKVDIIEDDSEKNRTTVGLTLPSKHNYHNTVKQPPQYPLRKDQVKFVKQKKQDVIIAGATMGEVVPPINYEDNTIYGGMGIAVYPEYEGGIIPFHKFIKENFKFSKKHNYLNDIMIATFVIEKDGKLDSINVLKDIGFDSKEELTRILSNSKKWYPGEENGKKRNCKFQLTVTFKSDTIKKTIFTTKTVSKIDTLEIKRITKYEHG